MNYRTRQEIFDIVARHLLTQGERSTAPKLGCAYRDGSGRKCAIGALIPDDLYSRDLEGFRADSPCILKAANIDASDGLFAVGLQDVHDKYLPHEWREKLEGWASTYNLSPAVLGDFA